MLQWMCAAAVVILILSDIEYRGFIRHHYEKYFPSGPAPVYKSGGSFSDDQIYICSNYQIADENGTMMGVFDCPLVSDPEPYIYCCGPTHAQRCCPGAPQLSVESMGTVLMITTALLTLSITTICQHFLTNTRTSTAFPPHSPPYPT